MPKQLPLLLTALALVCSADLYSGASLTSTAQTQGCSQTGTTSASCVSYDENGNLLASSSATASYTTLTLAAQAEYGQNATSSATVTDTVTILGNKGSGCATFIISGTSQGDIAQAPPDSPYNAYSGATFGAGNSSASLGAFGLEDQNSLYYSGLISVSTAFTYGQPLAISFTGNAFANVEQTSLTASIGAIRVFSDHNCVVPATRYRVTSTSGTVYQLEGGTKSNITLSSSSPRTVNVNTPIRLSATVKSGPTSGTVAFYDRSIFLGGSTFASGQPAVFVTPQLAPGTHDFQARLLGGGIYDGSVSNVLRHGVHASKSEGFILGQTLPISPPFVLADFNNDGKVDIASYTPSSGTAPAAVSIYLSNGDGTFQAPYAIGFGNGECSGLGQLASADTQAVGNADLIVTTTCVDGNFLDPFVFTIGQGNATFGGYSYFGEGNILPGDFNLDGAVDFFLGQTLCEGDGQGSFYTNCPSLTIDGQPGSIDGTILATADVNNDGLLDFIVGQSSPDAIVVYLGNGGTDFRTGSNVFPGSNAAIVCDFNNDGILDLATSTPGGVQILLGRGDGTFSTGASYSIPSIGGAVPVLTAGDINGDGKADLVTTGSVLYGNGDGTFEPAKSVLYAAPGVLADFNGDGRMDILTTTASGTLQVILGNK